MFRPSIVLILSLILIGSGSVAHSDAGLKLGYNTGYDHGCEVEGARRHTRGEVCLGKSISPQQGHHSEGVFLAELIVAEKPEEDSKAIALVEACGSSVLTSLASHHLSHMGRSHEGSQALACPLYLRHLTLLI
jgi:hypothetical protein